MSEITISIVTTEVVINVANPSLTVEFPVSTPGLPGVGVPVGGEAWMFLVKSSDTDYATVWRSFEEFLTANVIAYDNDEDAVAAGKAYYKAGTGHEGAALGTFIIL